MPPMLDMLLHLLADPIADLQAGRLPDQLWVRVLLLSWLAVGVLHIVEWLLVLPSSLRARRARKELARWEALEVQLRRDRPTA